MFFYFHEVFSNSACEHVLDVVSDWCVHLGQRRDYVVEQKRCLRANGRSCELHFQQRLSDLKGPYQGTYGIAERVLPPLLVIGMNRYNRY